MNTSRMRIVKLININVEPLLDVKEIIDKQNENVESNRSSYKQNKHKTYNSIFIRKHQKQFTIKWSRLTIGLGHLVWTTAYVHIHQEAPKAVCYWMEQTYQRARAPCLDNSVYSNSSGSTKKQFTIEWSILTIGLGYHVWSNWGMNCQICWNLFIIYCILQ